jgi:hypothetical protein
VVLKWRHQATPLRVYNNWNYSQRKNPNDNTTTSFNACTNYSTSATLALTTDTAALNNVKARGRLRANHIMSKTWEPATRQADLQVNSDNV